LARRLAEQLQGEARFDAFTRGRYSTDASIYQIMPAGVVLPRSAADIAATLRIAADHGAPVIMRGGGTSQNGQPIGRGLVVDCARHFNGVLAYDPEAGTITVEPGMVLERLNARVKADGWFFPVEPSTATRCTIGGMAGNNSCGARSLRYGKMSDNVLAMEALFHDGEGFAFGLRGDAAGVTSSARAEALAGRMCALGAPPGRGRVPLSDGPAPGGRLQPRCADRGPAEPRTPAGGLRGDACRHHVGDAAAVPPAGAPGDGGLPLPVVPRRHGDDAAHRRP